MGSQFTTIISVSAVIACTQGVFLFGLWLMSRRAVSLLWWAAAFGCLVVAAVLAVLPTLGGPAVAVYYGGALAIFAFSLMWQATRVFDGRGPAWTIGVGVPLLWLGAVAIAENDAGPQLLVASAGLLFVAFLLLALREVLRGWRENLPSRRPLAVALGVAALFIAIQSFVGTGAEGSGEGEKSLSLAVWLMLAATIAISSAAALALGMTRERQQRVRDVLSSLDPQTGALNRTAFLGQAARLVAAQLKARAPVTFVAVQFERGDAGVVIDQRMRAAHDVFTAMSRVNDIVARVHPGAFAVVMPDIEAEDALPLIQRVLAESSVADAGAAAPWHGAGAVVGLVSSTEVGHDLRALMQAAQALVEERRDASADVFAIYRASRDSVARRYLGEAPAGRKPGEPGSATVWPLGAVLD